MNTPARAPRLPGGRPDHARRAGVKSWLLLYWPTRRRAWLYRIPFYLLAFFVVPVLSVAALGAYVGPDRTLGGVPAVLFIVLIALFIRNRAIRTDATLAETETSKAGRLVTEYWPFPLQPPPPREVFWGYIVSAIGVALWVIGALGGGLAANGVLWPVLLLSGVEIEGAGEPPVVVVMGFALLAIGVGVPLSVYGLTAGPRLRERGRRLRAHDARRLIQRKGEAPVLLLRSFEDEELQDPRPLSLLQQRYEESLCRALRQLGPVITVGRPGDDLGFAGASRFYVSEEHWQEAIRYLITHTAAVVIIMGRTEGLWWEIETALASVPRQRLLLFFPFVYRTRQGQTRWAELKESLQRWNLTRAKYRQMEAERRERYRLFRERSVGILGDDVPEDLGKAFFLDFLSDGQARVLPSRSRLLRNYMVDAIPRYRRLRFDMTRTLWPFMDKLYKVRAA